jgi:hypothetical protein
MDIHEITRACAAARAGHEQAYAELKAKRDAVYADPDGNHVAAHREFVTDPAFFRTHYVCDAAWAAYERVHDAVFDECERSVITEAEYHRVLAAAYDLVLAECKAVAEDR